MLNPDSFETLSHLELRGEKYHYYSLSKLEEKSLGNISRLPFCLQILLENLLRNEDETSVTSQDIMALIDWNPKAEPTKEIAFSPSRVVLQDFTGVPAVVDLAAMREAMIALGGDPQKINPLVPSELVIDHSVQVDSFANSRAYGINVAREFERNRERYEFLKWGKTAFDNFEVVPPATGIVHQVNLEYLARVVFSVESEIGSLVYPDTLVGTDSHTTMINGLGILGWGVGGIEAEAVMLGQPISLLLPQVVGFRLEGEMNEGTTATDLVLTITEMLRKQGVVGKFVEFFGAGVKNLSLADRATLGNMSPEYGATCAIFPIDRQTIEYLSLTARDAKQVELVEAYAKAQGFFHSSGKKEAEYSEVICLDLSEVEASLAGPKRPQDRVPLRSSKVEFERSLNQFRAPKLISSKEKNSSGDLMQKRVSVKISSSERENPIQYNLSDGAVVIAAITSCTNTSNPRVMIAAGLVARNAFEKGLKTQPWVKTSLAPGSKVVTDYLEKAGLTRFLDAQGFNLVGYGCTTCIGNSGPLENTISQAIRENGIIACSVLSGNRNFEGRISPDVQANYLASPPLVVAYAIAGTMDIDFAKTPLGKGSDGSSIFLKDIWPSAKEIERIIAQSIGQEMFKDQYADVFLGDETWQRIKVPLGDKFSWEKNSTYIKNPPFFKGMTVDLSPTEDIKGLRVLALLGDSVTTDHISPAGAIPKAGPAGEYLIEKGFTPSQFNSFGARRGNHEVMMRGTFGNIRLRNKLVPGVEGGFTRMHENSKVQSIYSAAMQFMEDDIPLIVIGGKEYGSGSSRDWAAKGTRLLGVRAVLAESFERIHRSNLIGMGVLPLQFQEGTSASSLELTGFESLNLSGLSEGLEVRKRLKIIVRTAGTPDREFEVILRIDTPNEILYYENGGILHYVLRQLL